MQRMLRQGSPFTTNRLAGFTTVLKGRCEMFKGWLTYRLAQAVSVLVLLAVITAGEEVRAAQPASHDEIKAELDRIPPAWSQILPAADRFQLVLGGAGVLDKETGLVWEHAPETAPNPTTIQDWSGAQFSCNDRPVGGRKGWRLPTSQELASLIDPTVPGPGPTLPTGHPFSNVQQAGYWTATTNAAFALAAWVVYLQSGAVETVGGLKADGHHVWCVRGGQGVDPQ